MSKLRFNKSELRRLEQDLENYQQFLPALEMRRMQLLGVKARLLAEKQKVQQILEHDSQRLGEELPIMAVARIHLNRLVEVSDVAVRWENVAGIQLPFLRNLDFSVTDYDIATTPDWIEFAIAKMKRLASLQVELNVLGRRFEILMEAISKTTRRINLFEKVLIPETQNNCRKIRIYLADEVTSAVVRGKLAKSKTRRAGQQNMAGVKQNPVNIETGFAGGGS